MSSLSAGAASGSIPAASTNRPSDGSPSFQALTARARTANDGVERALRNRSRCNLRLLTFALVDAPLARAAPIEPLHDALIEDAPDRAAVAVGDAPRRARYSMWVRLLRAALRRRRRRA